MILAHSTTDVEQWGIFELALQGSSEGNPYVDVELTAQFAYKHRVIEVDGFYDGDGVYRIRFMPDTQGAWRYRTQSKLDVLNGVEGTFTCISPAPGNHGPVQVSNICHFSYVGKPHRYYLTYFGSNQPAQVEVNVPEGEQYSGEVVDIWNMTITPLEEAIECGTVVQLPAIPYQALIMRRIYPVKEA